MRRLVSTHLWEITSFGLRHCKVASRRCDCGIEIACINKIGGSKTLLQAMSRGQTSCSVTAPLSLQGVTASRSQTRAISLDMPSDQPGGHVQTQAGSWLDRWSSKRQPCWRHRWEESETPNPKYHSKCTQPRVFLCCCPLKTGSTLCFVPPFWQVLMSVLACV